MAVPKHVTKGSEMLQYVAERRAEQIGDNIADPNCVATEELPDARGVNYVFVRKNAARRIKAGIKTLDLGNGRLFYHLNKETYEFTKALLAEGVTRPTITKWLGKYEGFTETLNVTYIP